MNPFHLSIAVRSMDESIDFFVQFLKATVLHRDEFGCVYIDIFGNQITLKPNSDVVPNLPDFHFGVVLSLQEFDDVSKKILEVGRRFVWMEPRVWDPGTRMERRKMYLKDPTGYVIEIKGV